MDKINMDAVLEDILAVKSLEQDIRAVKEAQDAAKARIKDTMTQFGLEELTVDVFTVRYRDVTTSRFDSKRFSQQHKALYEDYLTSSTSFALPLMISMAPSWQAVAHSPQPLHFF